ICCSVSALLCTGGNTGFGCVTEKEGHELFRLSFVLMGKAEWKVVCFLADLEVTKMLQKKAESTSNLRVIIRDILWLASSIIICVFVFDPGTCCSSLSLPSLTVVTIPVVARLVCAGAGFVMQCPVGYSV
ncbi:multi-sensor signal transduction histidine kinase, partial [Striga asiatica]